MNYAKIFCKLCFTCCVVLLLVRFSLFAFKMFVNICFFGVRLYVEIFELANRLEVFSILI